MNNSVDGFVAFDGVFVKKNCFRDDIAEGSMVGVQQKYTRFHVFTLAKLKYNNYRLVKTEMIL